MKICKVCIQSDMLCSACSKKLEEGKIKQVEVDFFRAMRKLSKDKAFDIEIIDVLESGNRIFVVAESMYAKRIIGPGGKNVKKLSEDLGKPIKVLEKTNGTTKEIIEKLIGVPVLSVSTVYSPSESYKIRIDARYKKNTEPLSNIVGEVVGKKVTFAYQ